MNHSTQKQVVAPLILALCSGLAFSAAPARTFTNPINPGFYPDPSICRVDEDYYMVHSTFEYFPGVPVFHSKDLIHWQQIGHVLTRKSQLKLDKMRSSGGIFAPTLRFHKGTFYMVSTLVWGGGNFYVTATNAVGPWSEPIWLDGDGIDPSFFFDDDGKVYFTKHIGMGDGAIAQRTLNLQTGKPEGEWKQIWKGTGGVWPEGPHLYKINGKYYLVIAEGGTSYDHMVTVARSDSPWGPFESNPNNPILTHRKRPEHPIQALGHADLVETPEGWWAVFLGIRPQGGKFHHVGRETFLAPVVWQEGWPVVNGTGTIELTMPAPWLKERRWKPEPARDEFSKPALGLPWNYLRNPEETNYTLTERKGWLRLKGSAVTLNDADTPTFVGRRQTFLTGRIATRLALDPKQAGEEAGLVLRANEKYHFEIGVTWREGKRMAFLRRTVAGQVVEPVRYEDVGKGEVELAVEAKPTSYEFLVSPKGRAAISLGTASPQDLSSEKAGGFTGVYAGLYASGTGKPSTAPADFDWFEMVIQER